MVRIAPVKLGNSNKTLWFDPGDLEVHEGDPVVVTTRRGTEFGYAACDVCEVEQAAVDELKSDLQPVNRIATDDDLEQARVMQVKSEEAFPVFREMAEESGLDMKPVSVDYLFDGRKAVFFFEADEPVDFRNLVRQLAGHFHIRVDMRQIGVRDQARMVGGIGHCGQELCCCRFGGEFKPVSIRMAKEQDLSLNPQKISGVCGRLMCCLRYEFDTYKQLKSHAPKANATIDTPEGPAKVTDIDVPLEMVTLRTSEGDRVRIPLAEFEPPEEGNRPKEVSAEVFEKYAHPEPDELSVSIGIFETASFTGTDQLSDHTARHNESAHSKDHRISEHEDSDCSSSHRRKKRSRHTSEDSHTSHTQDRYRKNKNRTSDSQTKRDEDNRPGKANRRRRLKSRTIGGQNTKTSRNDSSREERGRHSNTDRGQQHRSKHDQQKRDYSSSDRPSKTSQTPRNDRRQGTNDAAPKTHRRSRRRTHVAGKPTSGGSSAVNNSRPAHEKPSSTSKGDA